MAVLDAYWLAYPDGIPALAETERNHVVLKVRLANEASRKVARNAGFEVWGLEEEEGGRVEVWGRCRPGWRWVDGRAVLVGEEVRG